MHIGEKVMLRLGMAWAICEVHIFITSILKIVHSQPVVVSYDHTDILQSETTPPNNSYLYEYAMFTRIYKNIPIYTNNIYLPIYFTHQKCDFCIEYIFLYGPRYVFLALYSYKYVSFNSLLDFKRNTTQKRLLK